MTARATADGTVAGDGLSSDSLPGDGLSGDGLSGDGSAGEADRDRLDDTTRSRLTGIRSGKQSYYAELQRTKARLTSAVRALEGISEALVRTRDDPRCMLEEVLRAAAGHLRSDWTMIALRDGALPDLASRFLAAAPDGAITETARDLPGWLVAELASARRDAADDCGHPRVLRMPLTLDAAVLGRLVTGPVRGAPVEHADRWVMRILANQAAMSMHTAALYTTGARLRREAQQLYDEIARSSQDLQIRTAELARAEGRLQVLRERELLDAERHRIALDLHDSVAQYVLSAGLAVDVCRAEAADRDDPQAARRLTQARDLIAKASDQVRSVVFALRHREDADDHAVLPELLKGLTAQERPGLDVTLRLEGRPCSLAAVTAHGLARIAGEALFNISVHAGASRAIVRLRYTPGKVVLSVGDNGQGDPVRLRRLLRVEAGGDSDGRHQGLAGMARRAADLGGTFRIRRSPLGGVMVEARVPAGGDAA